MNKKNVTKNDLIDSIYLNTSFDKKDILKIVDGFLDELKSSLEKGNTIELRGFGTFEARLRNRKKGTRNPKTGKTVDTKPHYVAAFRAGQSLKNNLLDLPVQEDNE